MKKLLHHMYTCGNLQVSYSFMNAMAFTYQIKWFSTGCANSTKLPTHRYFGGWVSAVNGVQFSLIAYIFYKTLHTLDNFQTSRRRRTRHSADMTSRAD